MQTQNTLSVADAALRLGITEDDVLRLVGTKQLAAEIRIAEADLVAFQAQEGDRKSGVVNEHHPGEAQRTD
jgi:hypothetical protein